MSAIVPRATHDRERGQIIVIFALALVAIIAMVGLVLDGGSAFAQRRDQQSAADLAALAGANDYLLNHDDTLARARARTIAEANGYKNGTNGVVVTVVPADLSTGLLLRVDISAPHPNNFSSILGMPTWNVATTATAKTGFADTATGAGPLIFSNKAFDTFGTPLAAYGDKDHPFTFGDRNNDFPNAADDIAWTDYNGADNVNTDEIRDIIRGTVVYKRTMQDGQYIGQHTSGYHNDLFDEMNTYLSGENIPVPIVDEAGRFTGWATFHVVSADGSSNKTVTGYFVTQAVDEKLTVEGCGFGACPRFYGTLPLELVN